VDSADPATWTALGTLGGADPVRDIARRETALARAVTLDPRCAHAWTALGRLYLARADSAETEPEERDDFISRARRALDNARAAEPGNAHAWLGTALLHSARGDEGEAAGAFRMASGLGAGVEADVGRALTGLRASSGRGRAADTDGAFKPRPNAGTKVTSAGGCYAAARRAVEAAPADPTARLALALAAEAKGLFEEAAAAFDDATSLSRAASSNGGGVYDVVAREASEGAERTRSRLDGSPAIDTRVGALSIDPTASGESVVASVAASADNLRSTVTAAATARRVFRDRCESHAHVAAVEACVGTACSLAGDPDTAVRFLARAVHSDPGSVAFRGELARVATYTSRGHAVTAAGCLVPAPSAQSVVTPTYTSPEACAIARASTVASTVHAAAAAIASKGGPCTMKDVGTSLAKAYHLSPCGTSGEDAYALLALVAARRVAVGDGGGGDGVRAWESSGDGSPSSNFRLAAAGRAAAAAETVASRNAHLACATLCAASDSAMVECTDTALVYARRCAQVGAGKGPVPATAASTQIARCLWAAGDDAGCAAELRSAVAVGAAPLGFNSATSTPAVVAGARDVAASHLALLLPSGSTGADVSSAPCVIVSQACAALAAGDFKRAESLLRDAQRHAVESTVRRGGVQPYLGSTSRALLGSTLLARSMPTERGGGGEPKCAKEAGKILAKAMRGTKHLLGDGSSLAAACGTLEALAKA
jgi:superkiller protein 3